MASETNATSTAEPTGIMDSSTHSTSSQPNNPAVTNNAAAAAPTYANAGPTSSTGGSSPKRGPPPPQQQQLLKLREANMKYKNLLKLAKERIQEQEGLLDERRCEFYTLLICVQNYLFD